MTTEVQRFYERYPYPPPIDNLEGYRQRWNDHTKRRSDYHLFWPTVPYRDDQSILIAGCGTSQAAKHALRWPAARIVGIDFSATSVQCTEALKQKYKLKNLSVHQLPVERVGELGIEFDQIVCTGVLHHLPDPDVGLKALRGVLAPQGAMHLMVYALYGRAGIYMIQDFCRRLGVEVNDDGIRQLSIALGALPPGHPLGTLLPRTPELLEDTALADALLHPQDRAYSVPQLLDFLGQAGLVFGRWVRQAPYSVRCGVMARIPQATQLAEVSIEEQYALVELFRGTMVRHSVVVYGDERSGAAQRITFAGDAWHRYVPLHVTDTVCVRDRLPPGAAGVLINQNHTYRDLYLPIDAEQRRIFDAIDGVRTIAELAGDQLDMARTYFETLWWYDQVVFDASRSS